MKKRLISSILALVLCLSIISGATFALFTSESKINISIQSGKVEYVSTIVDLKTYSMGVEQAANSFENGGTANINENTLKLDLMTPGDKAEFEIAIANNSNVTTQYQVVVSKAADKGLFAGLKISINGQTFTGVDSKSKWASLQPDMDPENVKVSIELPVEAGNEYQDKSTELLVTVYAVQGNAEVYDEVIIENQTDLNTAVANVNAPTKLLLGEGNYNLSTSMAGKDIIFAGSKDTVIDTTTNLASSNDATIGFEGVTVKYSDSTNYRGLTHTKKVTYTDCVINGKQFLYAPEVEFVNCVFNNKADYAVWTYGATDVTFTNCTFNTGGKAVLVYNESKDNTFVANITANNCTFYSDGTLANDKAAVETGQTPYGINTYHLEFNNCSVYGFNKNNSDSPLWGNKNSMDDAHLTVVANNNKEYAVAVATAPDTVATAVAGNDNAVISLPTGDINLTENMSGKNLTFIGTKDTVIDVKKVVAGSSGSTLIFDGVTLQFANAGYNGFTHTEKVVYKNCYFTGTQFLYAKDVEFINCTFDKYDASTEYSVWTYGAQNVTFTNCTFNTGGKAILVYNEYTTDSFVANITLNNCVFNSDNTFTDKAVVETGQTPYGINTYNLTFNGCSYNGFTENKSTSPLWGNKNNMDTNNLNVVIDGVDVY